MTTKSRSRVYRQPSIAMRVMNRKARSPKRKEQGSMSNARGTDNGGDDFVVIGGPLGG